MIIFYLLQNGKVHRTLTHLAFKNLLHPFQPFIIGQRIIGPLIAMKFDIPLIFYGENQAKCGNKIKENSSPKMSTKFFSNKSKENIILGGEPINKIIKDYKFRLNDFELYIPPNLEDITAKNIEQRYLGYYIKWDQLGMFLLEVKKSLGFIPNSETEGSYSKYSSIDDKIDPFHYYSRLLLANYDWY